MTESERLVQFVRELTSRLGGAVSDMVPPEAQHHLQNAQRELLTALFLIYEHQAAARRAPEVTPRRRTASARAAAPRKTPARLQKIDLD